MGEIGALPEDRAPRGRLPRPRRARARLPGVPRPAARRRAARPGRAVHGVRRPVLPQRLPAGQPDPRLERPRLPRSLAGRDRAAARDEQLPRVHRPPVPRPVRGRLRPGDPRGRRGHDQADRELDHRPRVVGGLGRASAAAAGDRPLGRRRRRGPRGHGRRAAAAPRRPRRRRSTSATRPPAAWCASACRTSRSRSTSSSAASTRCAPRAWTCGSASTSACDVTFDELRERHDAVVLATGSRVPRDLGGPRPRARRRPLRDGLPLRAHAVRAERRRRPDHRRGQARRRHRRRRHRRRLRRAVGPRGRRGDRPARAAARAARPPARRPDAVAPVAAEVPPLLRDGGGQQRAGTGEQDFAITTTHFCPARTAASRRCTPRTPSPRPRSRRSRAPSSRSGPTSCCSRWASCTPSRSCSTRLGVDKDPRGNVKAVSPTRPRVDGVFAAGDARRGQSLIVWAINEGRQCARMVDRYLGGLDDAHVARGRRRGPRGPAEARRRQRDRPAVGVRWRGARADDRRRRPGRALLLLARDHLRHVRRPRRRTSRAAASPARCAPATAVPCAAPRCAPSRSTSCARRARSTATGARTCSSACSARGAGSSARTAVRRLLAPGELALYDATRPTP